MDPAPIYTITVFGKASRETRRRTWGWLPAVDEADHAVLTNLSDMFERGYYRYAAVEEVPPGLCPQSKVVAWYRATYTPGTGLTVTRLEAAPEGLANYCFFSMG